MPQKLGLIVYKVGKKPKQNVGGKLEYTGTSESVLQIKVHYDIEGHESKAAKLRPCGVACLDWMLRG